MSKVRFRYSTREKGYCTKIAYHTKTITLEELPKSNFHEHYKPIDFDEVGRIVSKWVNENNPNTINKVLWFQILEQYNVDKNVVNC